jgi:hypothetical protein
MSSSTGSALTYCTAGSSGPQGMPGPMGPQGMPGPTYPLYIGSAYCRVASRGNNTTYHFDFSNWLEDFNIRFPCANPDNFMVIPYPNYSKLIMANAGALAFAGPGSLGDYPHVMIHTTPADYYANVGYIFKMVLGSVGLWGTTVHTYSTGVPTEYNINFIGGVPGTNFVYPNGIHGTIPYAISKTPDGLLTT